MRSLVVGLVVALLAAEPAPPPPEPVAVPPPNAAAAVPIPESPVPPGAWLLPFAPRPGWFAAFEAGVLMPRLEGQRVAPAGLLSAAPVMNGGELDSVGTGRASLGYRLDGWGEATFTARFAAGNHQTVLVGGDPVLAALLRQNANDDITVRAAPPGAAGSTSLTTRFDLSSFDFGLGRHEDFLGPLWDVRWQAGGRAAFLFADDRRQGADAVVQASNHFAGAGPAAGLGLSRALGEPGPGTNVSLFARAGGSVLFGQSQVTFREDVAGAAREARERRGLSVPTVEVEAGVSIWPGEVPGHRLMLGYRYERWWGVGDSQLGLTMHGLFFRVERNF